MIARLYINNSKWKSIHQRKYARTLNLVKRISSIQLSQKISTKKIKQYEKIKFFSADTEIIPSLNMYKP